MAELRADFPAEPDADTPVPSRERSRESVEREAREPFPVPAVDAVPSPAAYETQAPRPPDPVALAPRPAAPVPPAASAEPEAPVAIPAAIPSRAPEPPVVASPISHAPQVIASFAPPPATYQEVSEHGEATGAPTRPVRRRQESAQADAGAEPLKLVETAKDKVAPVAIVEEESPRPPVRRRRRDVAAVPAEPLQLVETAPGAEPAGGGNPPG